MNPAVAQQAAPSVPSMMYDYISVILGADPGSALCHGVIRIFATAVQMHAGYLGQLQAGVDGVIHACEYNQVKVAVNVKVQINYQDSTLCPVESLSLFTSMFTSLSRCVLPASGLLWYCAAYVDVTATCSSVEQCDAIGRAVCGVINKMGGPAHQNM